MAMKPAATDASADTAKARWERDVLEPTLRKSPERRGQFAGFGTPEETNERYKQLLGAGGTGLSVAFDLPTLMGRDPDHPLSLGEVGKCGVAVSSLRDMETLLDGVPLHRVPTA